MLLTLGMLGLLALGCAGPPEEGPPRALCPDQAAPYALGSIEDVAGVPLMRPYEIPDIGDEWLRAHGDGVCPDVHGAPGWTEYSWQGGCTTVDGLAVHGERWAWAEDYDYPAHGFGFDGVSVERDGRALFTAEGEYQATTGPGSTLSWSFDVTLLVDSGWDATYRIVGHSEVVEPTPPRISEKTAYVSDMLVDGRNLCRRDVVEWESDPVSDTSLAASGVTELAGTAYVTITWTAPGCGDVTIDGEAVGSRCFQGGA